MIQDTVRDKFDAMRALRTDDVLSALGLERRRTPFDVALPAAGMFFAGVVVGAGVALLVAPKSGRETRRELRGRASELSHRLSSSAGELAQEVRNEVFGSEESRSANNGGSGERKAESHRPASPQPPAVHGPQK